MHRPCCHGKTLPCLIRQPRKQRGQIVSREPIERPPQAIVVQLLCRDAGTNQALDGLVGKELWDQVQATITEAKPIEDHRQHRLT